MAEADGRLAARDDGLTISTDRRLLDLVRIRAWLAASYWASDRTPDVVARSIENSRPYGVYAADGGQIGFARVTTDLVSFAWLGDVVIDETWRGRGIGRWLVATVVADLRAHGVPRFLLATRDAHRVYAPIGFEPLRIPHLWMEIDDRATRPKPEDVGPPADR